MSNIKGFSKKELKASLMPDIFHLILFPTEECNFRCVYCYENFAIGKMQPWLINATKAFLSKKIPHLKYLNLSWFGGEPLVAKRIVFDIAQFAFDLAQQYDCQLIGDITTNGALLDVKTLTTLVALKQNRFQISIDGAKDHHDTTRLTRNGRGSFDKVWGRLIAAAATDLDFHITLRVHVTTFNQKSVIEFCDLFTLELAQDPRFRLFFKAIEDLGGNNQTQLQLLVDADKPRKVAAQLQQRYFPKSTDKHYICYAAKPNSITIRANGILNKCTVALQDASNVIGKINPDGSLEVNNQMFSTWTQGFVDLDVWKMACPHSYMEAQKQPKSEYTRNIAFIEVA